MSFTWNNGVFLSAMLRGDWVLLDELNLASQSVLEGLNACFDHREEIFIPDIGKLTRYSALIKRITSNNVFFTKAYELKSRLYFESFARRILSPKVVDARAYPSPFFQDSLEYFSTR